MQHSRDGWSITRFVVRHPRAVLALFVVVTAALGWQARYFTIDASPETLIMEGDENYIRTQMVNQRFSPQEFLLLAYRPRAHRLLSERSFADIGEIADRLQKLERVESVRSLVNVPLLSLMDDGLGGEFDPQRWTIAERDFAPEALRRTFRDHPIYENLLISRDQSTAALQVLFRGDEELQRINSDILDLQRISLERELSEAEAAELERLQRRAEPIEKRLDRKRAREIDEIRDIAAEYEERADIYLGGVHVLGDQLIRIIRTDLAVFGTAVGVAVCLILLVLFRRRRWMVIPATCCAVSVLSTMGLFALLGLKTTVISSNFIALQLILTLALVVHLIVQYRQESTERPDSDQLALVEAAVRRKAAPILYAGLTTSVGFAALLASGIKPVVSFGWMMIVAMAISIAASLVLFPALMALTGQDKTVAGRAPVRRLLGMFEGWALNRPVAIALISAAVAAGGIAGLTRLQVENSFIDYFRDSTRVHRELSFIDRHLGGSVPLDVIYTIPEREQQADLVLTAETALTLKRIHRKLEQYPAVGKTLSVASFTALAREVNDGEPLTEYELTAIYRTLDEELREDLVGTLFSPEHDQARFSLRIQDTTPGLNRGELLEDMKAGLRELGIAGENLSLTNLFVLYQEMLEQLFRSQILTLGIVYAALALMFLAIFRSLPVALIGIAPNILLTLAVLGAMGWLGIPLDLMTITIAAIAMGIAVDDTIHYIHRYLEERHEGSGERAVQRSHLSVGYAIVYTSIIVIAGFSMLVFSDFMPSVYFGLLTALTLGLVMVIDLSLLPALLNRFVGASDRGRD